MTTQSQTFDPGAPRDLPTWLSVAVIIASLLGGGGLVWWYFSKPPQVVAVPLADGPRQMPVRRVGGGGNAQPPRNVEWTMDVRPGNNNSFQARAGDVQMWVRPRDGQPEPTITIYYRNQLVPRDQLNLLRATMLVNNEDQVKRLSLTPEQVEALRKVRNVRGMRMSPEDETAARAAWAAYDKAPSPEKKNEAKAALLGLLDSLGKKNLDATKTALTESVTAVRGILTPDQQKALESEQR